MLKAIPSMKLGGLVVVLAGASMLAGTSEAMAKLVKSDSVSFKAPYTVNSANETNWETSASGSTCKVKSDGEFVPGTTILQAFPCALFGNTLGTPGNPTLQASSSWRSEDGTGTWGSVTLPLTKSEPPKETYSGPVSCVEEEETEIGSGALVSYPCVAKVKLVFNTLKKTVSGSYAIFEESTEP